ncbi:MAG: hypothetical protein A3A86_03385 [Elusimicrobia bacterium RIFCSPLOWO2_01_FULL_60_11]|nr:MAG: hypothetical protein A3A86_03385 [Elusimicrobia bacterium RIFCSPLOWO2_01_FULL_60_11]
MNKSSSVLCALVLAFAAVGCSHKAESKVKKGEITRSIDTPDAETDRYIEFDGIGAADQTIQNKSQKMSLSETAARKVAEEKMIAYLKGQQIDATTTVEQAMATDQRIVGLLSNTLRGAAVTKREWTSDDGCVLTIRLDKKKFKDQLMIPPK